MGSQVFDGGEARVEPRSLIVDQALLGPTSASSFLWKSIPKPECGQARIPSATSLVIFPFLILKSKTRSRKRATRLQTSFMPRSRWPEETASLPSLPGAHDKDAANNRYLFAGSSSSGSPRLYLVGRWSSAPGPTGIPRSSQITNSRLQPIRNTTLYGNIVATTVPRPALGSYFCTMAMMSAK